MYLNNCKKKICRSSPSSTDASLTDYKWPQSFKCQNYNTGWQNYKLYIYKHTERNMDLKHIVIKDFFFAEQESS